MSRHPETHGADAIDERGAADFWCDWCGRNVYSGRLYPYQGRHLCAACAVRESGQPRCDYCDGPTFGDYRTINRVHTLSIACGPCTDKWDSDEVPA